MADASRLICRSQDLREADTGVRFELPWGTKTLSAFAIRYMGCVHGYLNCCPHQGTELDWMPNEFFDQSRLYLVCATHGAVFAPDSGVCRDGPCKGSVLQRVKVEERDGQVYLSKYLS